MLPPELPSSHEGLTNLTADQRRHYLIEWLRAGRTLTASLAAGTFGVSQRTIARDFAHLREVLMLDVSYDQAEGTYTLAEEHTALPFLAFPSLAPILLRARLAPLADGQDSPPGTVRVRYSARAIQAYVARGGRLEGATNDDGSVDVDFAPPNLDEFICYVLSRGHHVEVLGPHDVRQRVQMEIRRMLTLYEDAPPASA